VEKQKVVEESSNEEIIYVKKPAKDVKKAKIKRKVIIMPESRDESESEDDDSTPIPSKSKIFSSQQNRKSKTHCTNPFFF
jgi:hypothetical protein